MTGKNEGIFDVAWKSLTVLFLLAINVSIGEATEFLHHYAKEQADNFELVSIYRQDKFNKTFAAKYEEELINIKERLYRLEKRSR